MSNTKTTLLHDIRAAADNLDADNIDYAIVRLGSSIARAAKGIHPRETPDFVFNLLPVLVCCWQRLEEVTTLPERRRIAATLREACCEQE